MRGGMADLVWPAGPGGEVDLTYRGDLIGRHTGRIGHARFQLDGHDYRLPPNLGAHQLHGGLGGFHSRWWKVEAVETSGSRRLAVLSLVSLDGDQGFPGTMDVTATYELKPGGLDLTIEARTDRASPASFSLHPYFNLSGDPMSGIDDHELFINATSSLAVDPELIPLGPLLPLTGTAADFSEPTRIGDRLKRPDPMVEALGGLDHSYVLDSGAPAARLFCPSSGLGLEILTNQVGLQAYTGQAFGGPGIAHPALALEPQAHPDAVNHPDFPSVILRPGETSVWRSTYRVFSRP
ncbi:MAG: Aldose 1-epimerase [Caulobacteraceae bacterium]|nr:Aldose 1-epimerase [Caulobacteraceae bacterium]